MDKEEGGMKRWMRREGSSYLDYELMKWDGSKLKHLLHAVLTFINHKALLNHNKGPWLDYPIPHFAVFLLFLFPCIWLTIFFLWFLCVEIQIMEGNEKQMGSHSNLSFSTRVWFHYFLSFLWHFAILCVPKEITMIQQKVSHLSFQACWPEFINAAAVRMAALYLSSLAHITGGCHWLSIDP